MWGSHKFQLFDTVDSGTEKIQIFRFVNSTQSTYPVSLFTSSDLTPMYFDVFNDNMNVTLLYLLSEGSVLDEHYIDFNSYKSNDVLRSLRLNTTCSGIKVLETLLLITCNDSMLVLDRVDLSMVLTLKKNITEFLTYQTGIQTQILYADGNQVFFQNIVYYSKSQVLLSGGLTVQAEANI